MFHLIQLKIFLLLLISMSSCNGQQDRAQNSKLIVGGGCDGCELMYEGMPSEIKSIDYSPNWNEEGQKLLITGTIYKADGKTIAPKVIIYYWQTDNQGLYAEGEGTAKRHGYIRGWIKSDEQGKYALYTRRPASYPNQNIPAHIHIAIKEPSIQDEYYIDGLVFDDDPLLTITERNKLENRGGNGILKIQIDGDFQKAERDITLGLHIPNYPKK